MEHKANEIIEIESPSGLKIYHQGPPLNVGPLPTLFYFALSGRDSLSLDPYNQPIQFLTNPRIRKISFDLPAHGEGDDPQEAMDVWAYELEHFPPYIEDYIHHCILNINYLIEKEICEPQSMAAAGLSRGGLIAFHLAAKHPGVHTALGFAPLTKLEMFDEYENLESDTFDSINVESFLPKLVHKNIRIYIGNRDVRVGTVASFSVIRKLSELAYKEGVRSPQAELIIFPSIGHKGHGTPSHIFREGANWLEQKLLAN